MGLDQPGPPRVTVTGNLLRGFLREIAVNDEEGDVTLKGNTLTENGVGISVHGSAAVTLTDNCLTGNTYFALYAPGDSPVSAPDNWWGPASWPRHTATPTGTGGVIEAAGVTFSPWREDANCLSGAPPPAG